GRDAGPGCARGGERTRGGAHAPGPAAGLAAQRLRVLRGYALEGSAGAGRERAAVVRAGGVAGVSVVHGARAGGARVDGGGDAGAGRGTGCDVRGGTAAFHGGGAGRADVCD